MVWERMENALAAVATGAAVDVVDVKIVVFECQMALPVSFYIHWAGPAQLTYT